ncbi:tail fiber protein [Escherichia coli]|uniref:Phage tail protein n=2 Tax=Escherichia coli TaxID=562 RepID=A0A3K0W5M3_ECOLX|nr:tail fiber protein [Escherichia coli]EEZ7066288.1 phage tail protein [Escherichia coli O17]EEW2134023.1 phage tail protein [Escherichia coli]EEW7292992.1 phage tail protein [Escherichia coli]EFA7487824.1 phage tail protein [Escherichia coli]EFB9625817.1 phage tail protein [Escherichia coli]
MSTRKFRTLITDIGLAKLAATTAPGGRPVRLTHMAVGDGNGELRQPQKNQTSLYNEVWRQSVNRVFTDPENPNRLIAELVIPPETGGFWVREIGVFDDTGTMIAVGNTAESYKPTREEGSGRAQIFRAVITVTSDAVVELVMDTTTILPTTDYIDEKIAEHARSRNHPDATLTEKGFTQLSSATNSTSETLAATPKAVKAAYDLAAGKAPASHTHPWNQITGVPSASLTAKGTVQLSSATNSESETEAATPKAVKALHDMVTSKYTGQDATTGRKGIVQLSSATNSNSETLAATPRAVKAAYDLAARKAPASHTHPWNQITGVPSASLTAKGTVQLSSATNSNSETLAATPRAVKAAYDLAASKASASHTHPWNQITGVPSASLTAKGTVQLSSATNSNSETLAATPKAVKAAYDLANSKAAAAHTHRWAQITDAPVFSSVARVIMGKQSIKDILDYLGLGEGSTLPVGVPVPWPSSRPPEGWLQCNGAAFTRTKYPKLAVAYPDLRLPDLRGEFIRGWDDLRMIDRGRLLLSTQEATYICTAIQAYHGVAGGADIQAGISFASHDNDIINITPDQPRTGNGILYGTKPVDRWAIARAGKLVSNEKDRWIAIRPRNIAFNYIVRAV